MSPHHSYHTYGQTIPGKHPSEAAEMVTFFNQIPPDYAKVALHIRNEGKRTGRQMQYQKSQGGFIKGASDIIIPGSPTFVCELKSLNKASKPSADQIAYLENAARLGAFACLCYGWKQAMEAFRDYVGR